MPRRGREFEIFGKLHKIVKDSEIKSINYKIVMDGLGINKKFRNRYGKVCYICKKEVDEDLEHIFINCKRVEPCIAFVSKQLNLKKIPNIDCIRYKYDFMEKEYLSFSYYTTCIWKIRNIMKQSGEKVNILALFKKLFNKWYISQTEI